MEAKESRRKGFLTRFIESWKTMKWKTYCAEKIDQGEGSGVEQQTYLYLLVAWVSLLGPARPY